MDFKSNLFNWTWIRYRLDTFFDYPNCILGEILTWPDPGWAKIIWVQVEQSRPKSNQVGMGQSRAKSFRVKDESSQLWAKSSWVANIESTPVGRGWYRADWPISMTSQAGPGPCRVESFGSDIESSRPGSISRRPGQGWCRAERQADVEPSRSGSMSSWVGKGRYWVERAQADFELAGLGPCPAERDQAHVEPRWPGKKSSWASSSQCRAPCRGRVALANIEPSDPKPMSSRAGQGRASPGRCRAEQVRVDVKPSGPRSILSWAGPGKYRAEQAQANVEPSGSGPISIRAGPGPCRAEQSRVNVESSRPELKSSWANSSRWIVRAQDDVESLGPMSSWAVPSRCRAERALTNVKPSGPTPMSSRPAKVDVE